MNRNTFLQENRQFHPILRFFNAGNRSGNVEVDDTEHRVTDTWVVGSVEVTVDRELLHAPLLGAYVHIGVDDAKHLFYGALLHLRVVNHIIAQALPRLAVGVHVEAAYQLGMARLDGTAHGSGTALRESSVMFVGTFGR